MKRYVLLIAAMVGLTAGCQAASPSFSSFYTNHFLTNGLVIKANLNPTQFDTNASSITITITNVSGISGGSHWTNPVGVLKPRSGQTTNVLTFVSGSADNATNTALVVGTVNAWTDPNSKLLVLRDRSTDVFYVTPNGSVEIGQSVGPWWAPDEGDILVGVHDVSQGDSDISAFHIAAVDDAVTTVNFASHTITLQSGVNAQVAATTKAEVNGVITKIQETLVPSSRSSEFRVAVESGGVTNSYATSYLDPVNSGVNYQTTTGNGLTAIALNTMPVEDSDAHENFVFQATALSEDMWNFRPLLTDASTPTGAYQFSTYNTLTSKNLAEFANNGTNLISIGPTGQIIFGPGTTNVLYRSGNNLVYTNGNAAPSFEVRNGSGELGYFGVDSGGNAEVESSAANRNVVLRSGLKTIQFSGNGLLVFPGSDNEISLAGPTSSTYFKDFGIKGVAYVVGSDDGAGNYTRAEINHSGNAGNIKFNSASGGTGNSRDFVFQDKGTNLVQISVADGITNALSLINILGNQLNLTFLPSGAPVLDSSTGFIWMGDTTAFQGNIIPDAANTRSIGTMAAAGSFADSVFAGTHYILGSNDAGANYTRLAINHTGNAGNIQYKSDALGTQTFRPHLFMVGSTNVAKFDTTSAAGETRFWLYDEDNGTMERVTVGAADSGGVGYKVLRIPN